MKRQILKKGYLAADRTEHGRALGGRKERGGRAEAAENRKESRGLIIWLPLFLKKHGRLEILKMSKH